MNIKKVRIEISPEVWKNILNYRQENLYGFVPTSPENKKDFDEFIYYYRRELYRPHVIITYDRIAYMSRFLSLIRITFDKNVMICQADSNLDRLKRSESIKLPVTSDRVIMEVKFEGKMPWWFKNALTKFDIQRSDFSKYRNSVAMLRGVKLIPISK